MLALLLAGALLLGGCTSSGNPPDDGEPDPDPVEPGTPTAFLQAFPGVSGPAPLGVGLDASGSSDVGGSIVRYDFDPDGDGTFQFPDSEPSLEHTYNEPGTYSATVRVVDNDGKTATASLTITVTEGGDDPVDGTPVAKLRGFPKTSGPAPLGVGLDASGSLDPDGEIVRYDWDPDGDGTFQFPDGENSLEHTYDTPGTFSATVRVTDDEGNTNTASLTITVSEGDPSGGGDPDPPTDGTPQARLQGFPETSGPAPLGVGLDASGSLDLDGEIVRYDWDAEGDGTYEILDGESNIEQTYDTPGTFNATVRVTDDDGKTDTATLVVTVTEGSSGGGDPDPDPDPDPDNIEPIAIATPDTGFGTAPLAVEFSSGLSLDVDGEIVSFEWEIDGVGVIGSGPTANYTFDEPGNYFVNLTVTDDKGATATSTTVVVVI